MAQIEITELLEAGVHFGHQTRRWNPKMRRFIFGERDGIYIIDLLQTQALLENARRFASDVATSLNIIFDRLARENHLKGRSPEEWGHSVSTYIYELGTIQPFLTGNEVALREFADELARKNNLSLQWDTAPEIGTSDAMRHLDQSEQSASIRRMVMLAMDTCPSSLRPSRGAVAERGIETLFSAGSPLP